METVINFMLSGFKQAYPNANQEFITELHDLLINNQSIDKLMDKVILECGTAKPTNHEWIEAVENFFQATNEELTEKHSQNLAAYQAQQMEILNLFGGFLQNADPNINMAELQEAAMQMPVTTNKRAYPKLFDNFVSLVLNLDIQDTQDYNLLNEAIGYRKEEKARLEKYQAESKAILEKIAVDNATQPFDWTINHPIVPLLKKFDDTLQRHLPQVYQQRQLGYSQEKIDKVNLALGDLTLPTSLAIFYQYFGGFDVKHGSIFGYPDILTLDEAFESYIRSIENQYLSHWSKAWFVIGDMDGDYLFVPISQSPMVDTPIYKFSCEDMNIRLYHESISAMLETTIESIEQGFITLDRNNWLDEDFDKIKKIRLKNSPTAFQYNENAEPTGVAYDYYDPTTWEREWQAYQTGEVDF